MVDSGAMNETGNPEVITIGETMVLVAPLSAEPLETAELFRLDAGGAESNVASHLADLGCRVAWVSQLGDDFLGHRIERLIRGRLVDTTWVRVDQSATTGAYFKDPGNGVQYFRAGSAASLMSSATRDGVPLERADIVHISGIMPALSATCGEMIEAVIDRVATSPTLLSFDVNYRSALWIVAEAAPALLAIARRADIVFVGLDEALTLWGTETVDEVRALLAEPSRLIVKDGDVGATEYSGDDIAFVAAIPTTVVEVVGAGDAFAAGYLHAQLRGRSAAERLQAGHNRAVLVLQSTSDYLIPDAPKGVQ